MGYTPPLIATDLESGYICFRLQQRQFVGRRQAEGWPDILRIERLNYVGSASLDHNLLSTCSTASAFSKWFHLKNENIAILSIVQGRVKPAYFSCEFIDNIYSIKIFQTISMSMHENGLYFD